MVDNTRLLRPCVPAQCRLCVGALALAVVLLAAMSVVATEPATCCGFATEYCHAEFGRPDALVELRPVSPIWPNPMEVRSSNPCLRGHQTEYVVTDIAAGATPVATLSLAVDDKLTTEELDIQDQMGGFSRDRVRGFGACRVIAVYWENGEFRSLLVIGLVDSFGRLHSSRHVCRDGIGTPLFAEVKTALTLNIDECQAVFSEPQHGCRASINDSGCSSAASARTAGWQWLTLFLIAMSLLGIMRTVSREP